jgi:GT2 family glycosyltransferase
LESIGRAEYVEKLRPEVIVADNNSNDNTSNVVSSAVKVFPTELRVLKVSRPGKSAAVNDAVKSATGDVLAFLDDDVTVDKTWLTAVGDFFRNQEYRVGQGVIRLPSPESDDPELLRLVERFRTIPRLEHEPHLKTLHSLNGANFFVARDLFDRLGGFDERLGPGASGTSEDVDFARRLAGARIAIGYAPQAIVYHRVDNNRLTEAYFRQSHRRQGASRFLIRRHGTAVIFLNLARAAAQFGYYTVRRRERERYRSKGRIYHYLGMLEAKQNHRNRRPAGETENSMDFPSLRP